MANDIVTIGNSSLQTKEYHDLRVVTFKDVDAVHERAPGTARKRFNDNRERFVEGEDYFKVKCSEVSPFFGQTLPNGFNPEADVILLTESGYLMLVKSFTDDLAWKVQRQLVKSYFRAKEAQNRPLTMPEYLLAQAQMMVEQEKKIRELAELGERNTEAIRSIGSALSVPTVDRDEWQREMNSYISKLSLDYSIPHQTAYADLYGALEDKTGCDLEARQRNLRRRLEQQGAPYKERQRVTKLSAVATDSNLRTTFEALVQKYAAHLAAEKWGQ